MGTTRFCIRAATTNFCLWRLLASSAASLLLLGAVTATAQPQGDDFATWKDVELSQQFKDQVAALKGGGAFNDAARTFLDTVLLAQFERDGNRAVLDDVRKKIRDRFLLVISNPQAFTQANTFVRDRLNDVARDTNLDPMLRCNAMTMIGELSDAARLPWTPAAETLASAAMDTELVPSVRVAALAGLGIHLAVISRLPAEQQTQLRDIMKRVLPSLLSPPKGDTNDGGEGRSPAASWMAARGLTLLPLAMNPVPPDVASQLTAMIVDASWPIDVRVRAAIALGKTVGPDSGVNGKEVVASIKSLAIAMIESDRADAQREVEAAAYRGPGGAVPGLQPRQPMPPMGPGMESLGPAAPTEDGLRQTVCRRAAWRLYSLGDAIVPSSKKGGLAALLDKDDRQPQQLAAQLKEAGESLDAEPFGDILIAALDALDPAGAKQRAAKAVRPDREQPDDEKPATKPDAPADEKPSDNPFGQ